MKGTEKVICIIMLLGMAISCKREKLDGDKSHLIGTWKWYRTKIYDPQLPTSYAVDTLYASDFADIYTIAIEEKGIMGWYKNGHRELKVNLVFDSHHCSNGQDLVINYCSYTANGGRYQFGISYGYPEGALFSIGTYGGEDWFPTFTLASGLKYQNSFVKVE